MMVMPLSNTALIAVRDAVQGMVVKILSLVILLFCFFLHASVAHANTLPCPIEQSISATFANGAGWDMCWESKRRENIVLSEIHFNANESDTTRVVSSIRLAQLHVAYDDSKITYNDVTQFGLGGGYMSTLFESECPNGELLEVNGRAGLCKTISSDGRTQTTSGVPQTAEKLTLLSVSQVGSYSYLVSWDFHDDGSISPSVGAAGALQRSSSDLTSAFGRELEGSSGKHWLNHTHVYYWRIDLDLGDSSTDDQVSEVSYALDPDGRRERVVKKLTKEAAKKIDPETMLAWYITDGTVDDITRAPGYVVEPLQYGHRHVRAESEAFSEYDFFVTKQSDCERFINENKNFDPECADDILEFINDESIVDQDIVIWHRISFHHVPRNEDRHLMHSHWDGFTLQARNLMVSGLDEKNLQQNTPPEFLTPPTVVIKSGEDINLTLSAIDPDDDNLTFTASGLPSGVFIDNEGYFSGAAEHAGRYAVTAKVSDGFHTTSVTYQWQVESNSSGLGKFSWFSVLSLLCMLSVRRMYRYLQ